MHSALAEMHLIFSCGLAKEKIRSLVVELQVYGITINHVNDFRYLGSMMKSSDNDLRRRRALAWTAFWKLEHLWKSSSIPISIKIKLFNTTCVTILLYGCESWVISKDMESKINSFGTSCYRIMLNIKRIDKVPNATVYHLTEAVPLIEKARSRQLKYLGHVLRMPDGEFAKEYALYVPNHGKRKRGRQRTLFSQYIHHLLGDTDGMMRNSQLLEMAQNRCDWRKLVVDCCAAER